MNITMRASGCVNGAQVDVSGTGTVGCDDDRFRVTLELAAGAPMWDPVFLVPIWLDAMALAGPLDDGTADGADPVPAAIHARQDLLDEDGRLLGELRAAVGVERREAEVACRVHVVYADCRFELGELVAAVDDGARGPLIATGAHGQAAISTWTARTGRGRTLVALTASHLGSTGVQPREVPTRALSFTRGDTEIRLIGSLGP